MSEQHKKEYLWETLTWKEIEERLKLVDTAILPCGAIEQHGPHLPVDVDYYDAVFMAKKVAEQCADPKPFVLPAIPACTASLPRKEQKTWSLAFAGRLRMV